jgi:hypothetical protein
MNPERTTEAQKQRVRLQLAQRKLIEMQEGPPSRRSNSRDPPVSKRSMSPEKLMVINEIETGHNSPEGKY